MYLAFKKLKIKRKEGNQSKEKKEIRKTDTFGDWSLGNTVCLMSLRLKYIKLDPAKVFEARKNVWFMFLNHTSHEERYGWDFRHL